MDEIWKDIEGYEGFYQVSNRGKVKSMDRYTTQQDGLGRTYSRFMKGRILSLNKTNGKGYKVVSLHLGSGNTPKNNYIHVLVAKHFVLNLENKSEVNHIDGVKSNNDCENLEWCTRSENQQHAYNNGLNVVTEYTKDLRPKGSECHLSKLTEEQAIDIFQRAIKGEKMDAIAEEYNVSRGTVEQIKYRQTWKHIHKNNKNIEG